MTPLMLVLTLAAMMLSAVTTWTHASKAPSVAGTLISTNSTATPVVPSVMPTTLTTTVMPTVAATTTVTTLTPTTTPSIMTGTGTTPNTTTTNVTNPRQPTGPQVYTIKVGAEVPSVGLGVNAFFPWSLTVFSGDTVVFQQNTKSPHGVLFLVNAANPAFLVPWTGANTTTPAPSMSAGAALAVNPLLAHANPASGSDYDGTRTATSGLMSLDPTLALPTSWNVTMTKAGSYWYYCFVHGQEMTGTIKVMRRRGKPTGSGNGNGNGNIPTPTVVNRTATTMMEAVVNEGLKALNATSKNATSAKFSNKDGTTTFVVRMGGSAEVTVKGMGGGSTAHWTQKHLKGGPAKNGEVPPWKMLTMAPSTAVTSGSGSGSSGNATSPSARPSSTSSTPPSSKAGSTSGYGGAGGKRALRMSSNGGWGNGKGHGGGMATPSMTPSTSMPVSGKGGKGHHGGGHHGKSKGNGKGNGNGKGAKTTSPTMMPSTSIPVSGKGKGGGKGKGKGGKGKGGGTTAPTPPWPQPKAVHVDFLRFDPPILTVKRGDTVKWVMDNTNVDPHTVTFLNGQAPLPLLTPVPAPTPTGQPVLLLNPKIVMPQNAGKQLTRSGLFNSGLLPATATANYTVRTSSTLTAGNMSYVCALHAMGGMVGSLVITT